MADIRINALATTAASTASDDFIAVDGSANGTRKLNAFSPTFGGNLTVSGTGTGDTIPYNILAGGNKRIYIGYNTTGDYGALNVADTGVAWKNLVLNQNGGNVLIGQTSDSGQKLQVNGTALISGNLTVSGTGNSTIAGPLGLGVTPQGSNKLVLPNNKYIAWQDSGALESIGLAASTDNALIFFNIAERARITSGGNVLIGTTTDSANGKLQLATHTTSAGGIGLGPSTSFFADGSGGARLSGASLNYLAAGLTVLNTQADATYGAFFGLTGTSYTSGSISGVNSMVQAAFNTKLVLGTNASQSILLYTNNTTALTLDSSQNATFAGNVTINKSTPLYGLAVSGSRKGFLYFDGTNTILGTDTGSVVLSSNSGNVVINNGQALQLGNAYVGGAPTATGYVTIKDSNGTTYKVPVVAA